MFNPSNLDDVCVQATHLEARGKHDDDSFMNKSSKFDNKDKIKDKGKETTTITKEGERPTCSHCRKGHDVSKCWKLHPELRPKKYEGDPLDLNLCALKVYKECVYQFAYFIK